MTWDAVDFAPTGLRVMYWPNELNKPFPGGFLQAGGRAAFAAFLERGAISALEIVPYRAVRTEHADLEAFERTAEAAIDAFRPDILFVQHVYGTDLREAFWAKLRQSRPHITLVYHEGDPFDRFAKRVDAPTIGILKHADLVLACGLGTLADILQEPGAKPVGYLPHCFVKSRFAVLDPRETPKTHDLMMIGTRGTRRKLKFLYVPGGRKRDELATRLSKSFGKRFALYGNGWSHLEAALGPVPFYEQEKAIQSARISVNWDHFDSIDYYFSDRLPISLAAGVPHVTSWHVGYNHLFADTPGLYSCRTVTEVIEASRWLLSRTDESLMEEGLAAKAWVFATMEAVEVFGRGLAQSVAIHKRRIPASTGA
jgi:hypothetical protein